MSDQNFSAIRARLRYETIDDFVEGYSRFISAGGMFIPMKPSKLKPIGTTIRFQFLLGDGSTALLGEGLVLQVRTPDDTAPNSPVGMLIKFTKLSQESKVLVDRIIEAKSEMLKPRGDESPTQRHPTKPFMDDEDPMKTPTPPSFESEGGSPLSDFLLSDDGSSASEVEEEEAGTQDSGGLEQNEGLRGFFGQESEISEAEPEPEVAELAESEHVQAEPETTEAPSIEQETPTAEAPSEEPAAEPVGPKELGRTAGGLQILAFDALDDDEMKDLENFSFGGEESDIDDIFDGLFGGGGSEAVEGAVDDMFSGAFGGENTGDSMSSVEFELPEDPDQGDEDSDSSDEEDEVFVLEDEAEVEPEVEQAVEPEVEAMAQPVVEEEPKEESNSGLFDFDFVNDEPSTPEGEVEEEEEVFVLENEVEPNEPNELGDSAPEEEPWSFDGAESESAIELDADELDESETSDVEEFAADSQYASDSDEQDQESRHEIHSLLDHFEDEDDHDMSLRIGIIEESKQKAAEPEEEDSESLEALLASARKEIEEKSTDEPREEGDLIDQLIGDDLPPPPVDSPIFVPPAPKKKKGFLSKLFDKD